MQVAENPHSAYGLTDNVEKTVENEKVNAEKSSKQKEDLQSLLACACLDWGQLCLSYHKDLLYLQRKDHQIPLNFQHHVF